MKKCSHCREWLSEDEFGERQRIYSEDGDRVKRTDRESWCKECKRRLSRFKHGTETRLDILSELCIKLEEKGY